VTIPERWRIAPRERGDTYDDCLDVPAAT